MQTLRRAGLAGLTALSLMTTLAARGGDGDTLTEEARAHIAQALDRAMTADVEAEWNALAARKCAGEKAACEKTGKCTLTCDCAPSGELLAYHLKSHPAGWQVVAPKIHAYFADEKSRERALDLLAWSGSQPDAQKLAVTLLDKDAKGFSRDHLLAFSESGIEPMKAEIKKRAKKDIRLAAADAIYGGDDADAHVKRLAKATKSPLKDDAALLDAYTAARALKTLGHEEHWTKLQTRIEDEVIRALDDGATERARDLALSAQFCTKQLGGAKGYGLSYLESRVAYHRAVGSGDVADADQVFKLISHVASR